MGRMIQESINRSKEIGSLSPKALALYGLLIPKYNSYGKMNGDPYFVKGEVCPRVQWLDIPAITEALQEISDKTDVKWWQDEDGNYWIHSLKFEEEQPGLRKDRRGRDVIPSYPGYIQNNSNQELEGSEPEGEEEVEDEVEVEVEGEEKGEKENAPVGALPPLAQLWNAICPNLPPALQATKERRAKERIRLKRQPDLVWWRKVFERVRGSPFCNGENDRGWLASYDWIIKNDENALKVMEGKYDGKPRGNYQTKPTQAERNAAAIKGLAAKWGLEEV